ncbi:flagellar hook-length control protein FliK [Schnuerera sp. xch1]|uniref:flagellar hook-length control protein FliK n=1 Tax=Schnuerera sp. xch1 TaxID=2874283 RepID=UPI001CBFD8A3|nr:flagellar hook-length control protein FliK [Schnuerera sp. xch1]MBZ2173873.1 flagellar hook-length control protein FliK [Schnuerera sp. xch1]
MFDLAVMQKDVQPFTNSSSKSNSISKKENNKDFATVLEEEKQIQDKSELDNKKDGKIIKKDKTDKKITDSKTDVKKEQKTDEIKTVADSLYGLILLLKSEPEELNKLDLESLKVKLNELSTTLQQMADKKDLSLVAKEDIEAFERLETLLLSLENKMSNNTPENKERKVKLPIDEMVDELENIRENIVLEHEKGSKTDEQNKPLNLENEGQIEHQKNADSLKDKNITSDNTIDFDIEGTKSNNSKIDVENVSKSGEESKTVDINSNPHTIDIFKNSKVSHKPTIDIEKFDQIDRKEVIKQIVDKIKLTLNENKQEVRIKLKPDVLGELLLKMEVKEGAIMTKIMVDNYRTKELIETNLLQFKEQVEDNGMKIKTFEVFVGTNEDFEQSERENFYYNKHKSKSKIKIKDNNSEGLRTYDNNFTRREQTNHYEGQLNLFA